ncbi:MAG: CRISPR-associated endonuclease Cas1 [bacterium]
MNYLITERATLTINNDFSCLDAQSKSFSLIKKNTNEKIKIPASVVRDIMIFGEANISFEFISLAEKNLIPVHILTRSGRYKASLRFDFPKNVFLRYAQFISHHDEKNKLDMAKKFIEAKLNNQNMFLQKIRAKHRVDKDFEALTVNELRGVEGSRAQQYFKAWIDEKLIKSEDFRFLKRVKKDPKDPFNQILSLAYSSLNKEIHTQLLITGLDPYIAYLHEQKYSHPALSSDFLEIYRGLVDHHVIKNINLGKFSNKMFERDSLDEAVLSSEGFKIFFLEWSNFLKDTEFEEGKNLIKIINRDIKQLFHFCMGDKALEQISFFKWRRTS